jgi:integrase
MVDLTTAGDLVIDFPSVFQIGTFTTQLHPMTTFSAFNATAQIRHRSPGRFSLNGRFTLGTPEVHGKYWTIVVRKDEFLNGKMARRRERVRLALATEPERHVLKLKQEYMAPLNKGLSNIGSATNFQRFAEDTYRELEMPELAETTQQRYNGVIDKYLVPAFGKLSLADLTVAKIQTFFTAFRDSNLSHESVDKIRDVLASILRKAREKYHLISEAPMEHITLPRAKKKTKKQKPHVTPEQFDDLVHAVPEPYATMLCVAVFTGLRISELIGLKWGDIGTDSITVDERYCRGDWSEPKSEASNATIGVDGHVIQRIHRLKLLTVEVNGGGPGGKAIRKYRLVKKSGPDDLVFQSVKDGKPMRDNNVLTRFIKPAARKLGLGFVNWRCLRTSRATWMIEAGANPKDVQGQLRHSKIQTTLDIYAQFVPESQRRAIEQTSKMVAERIANAQAARSAVAGMVN